MYFPASIEFLDWAAFHQNLKIGSIVFEDNSHLWSINIMAFYHFYSTLNKLVLPTNVNEGFSGYIDSDGNRYKPGDALSSLDKILVADLPYHTLTEDDVIIEGDIITKYNGGYSKIIVPEVIENSSIKGIGKEAFHVKALTGVKLSNNITTISDASFQKNIISELILPENISEIGKSAFLLNNLKELSIKSKNVSIGSHAFVWNNLKKLSIKSKNVSIDSYAFQGNFLEKVELPEFYELDHSCFKGNNISEVNGRLSNGLFYESPDSTYIVSYGGGKDTINFIPESVTGIGYNAFGGCGVKYVEIPPSVKTIGPYAFNNNLLTNVVLPDNVTYIGYEAFSQNNLDTIVLPASPEKEGCTCVGWKNQDSVYVNAITDFEPSYFADFEMIYTGIQDELETVKLYPNPVSQFFYIEAPCKIDKLAVYSYTGRLIFIDENIEDQKVSLNLKNGNSGLYFIAITIKGKTNTYKVMKQAMPDLLLRHTRTMIKMCAK